LESAAFKLAGRADMTAVSARVKAALSK